MLYLDRLPVVEGEGTIAYKFMNELYDYLSTTRMLYIAYKSYWPKCICFLIGLRKGDLKHSVAISDHQLDQADFRTTSF